MFLGAVQSVKIHAFQGELCMFQGIKS